MKLSVSLFVILLVGFSAPSVRADITSDLIAWYPFDGNLTDASGNTNHGTAMGGLVLTTDRFGNPGGAYEFNGTNSWVLIPNSASLSSPDTAVTQAAWVLLYGPSQIGTDFGPVTMKSTATPNAFMYRMTAQPAGFGAAFNDWFTGGGTTTALDLNRWYHVATVFDGTSVGLFLNGARVDSIPLVTTMTADGRDMTIGADFPGILEIFWGKIDDVRIYSRALTDSDIAEFCPCATAVRDTPAIPDFTIRSVYPNPSSDHTNVDIVLGTSAFVELSIHDVSGRRVRGIESRALPPGPHTVGWDGRNDSGAPVPSGVYFFRMHAAGNALSRRIIRVR